jgi:hypothetical protein
MAKPDEDDDDEVDLGISLATVARIVDVLRAVQVTEETDPDSLADEDAEERVPPEDADEIDDTEAAEMVDTGNADDEKIASYNQPLYVVPRPLAPMLCKVPAEKSAAT